MKILKLQKDFLRETIKFISKIKKEPKWMLDWRLKAFNRLKVLKEPNWQKPKYPKIRLSKSLLLLSSKKHER